jgi:hypothetical protein
MGLHGVVTQKANIDKSRARFSNIYGAQRDDK